MILDVCHIIVLLPYKKTYLLEHPLCGATNDPKK